jgi:hypothetical protein
MTNRLADVDPLFGLVDVDVPQAVLFDDVDLFVLALAEMRVDDHGSVMAGMNEARIVPVLLHGRDHAVELPGRRRAARKKEMPRDIDLEGGIGVLADDVLIPRKVHQRVIVAQHRGRRRSENRHLCFSH